MDKVCVKNSTDRLLLGCFGTFHWHYFFGFCTLLLIIKLLHYATEFKYVQKQERLFKYTE